MDTLIISFCLVFLLLSFIVLSAVVIKLIDKVNLHRKLISEILNNLCDALGKEDEEDGIE
mgnify:CR=1 FL=1